MADPVTIGALAASAIAMAADAALKGVVGEAVKDAYKALRSRVMPWAGGDVEALEKTPASPARQSVIAEAIDGQSTEEKAALGPLAQALITALKRSDNKVGLDIGRLEALEVRLGAITVTEGTGARIDEVRAGTFSVDNISVGGDPAKKA